MSFAQVLDSLLERKHLPEESAQDVMDRVLSGDLGPERLAALVTALRAKGVHSHELIGFAKSMLAQADRIDAGPMPVLDNCGTGGAAIKAFNISTTAAFVAAAAGITVAKHGNRSVTRPSGSADVLERAGARLDLKPAAVEKVIGDVGIGFLFAPTFHPAMRHAGPVRKKLGIKTVFNLLGPLTNPAGADRRVLGVYDRDLLRPMGEALAGMRIRRGFVLWGEPGTDEATPCGPIHYVEVDAGWVSDEVVVDPTSLGVPRCDPAAIAPVDGDASPWLMRDILAGRREGPHADAVALNAGFALWAADKASDLRGGVSQAHEILQSGAGSTKLEAFIEATQS